MNSNDNAPAAAFPAAQQAGLAALRAFAPVLTAVIPAHNEAATIGETIRSLRHQERPPDRIIVVCDNCTDATAELAMLAGAEVVSTVGNTARKAGALNQVLAQVLPWLSPGDLILAMDADSSLSPNWLAAAAAILDADPRVGAVCGAFLGEAGGGVVGQVQRNEYCRYARILQAPLAGSRPVGHRHPVPRRRSPAGRPRTRPFPSRCSGPDLQSGVDHRG